MSLPWRTRAMPALVFAVSRHVSKDSPHTQFSSSIFRGSVSSSTSSFTLPFFLPFPFPLPLVVAVGGFFSFSVALVSTGGARLPSGCNPQQAVLGKGTKTATYSKTSMVTPQTLYAHTWSIYTYLHLRAHPCTHGRDSHISTHMNSTNTCTHCKVYMCPFTFMQTMCTW